MKYESEIYALYKGEEYITDGTIAEIAEKTGKTINFVKYMTYPIYKKRTANGKKRLTMILLDEEETA